ncbi:hypothetical protein GCM10008985_27480 [Halococcus dombrowskii]|uniref:Uncharacterized protein n=1 Tax=Halococcus dombrowskii TaxID=179637 RepID=A0AAV3SJP4_HALDO
MLAIERAAKRDGESEAIVRPIENADVLDTHGLRLARLAFGVSVSPILAGRGNERSRPNGRQGESTNHEPYHDSVVHWFIAYLSN